MRYFLESEYYIFRIVQNDRFLFMNRDRNINLTSIQKIEPSEYALYQEWYRFEKEMFPQLKPDIILYLRTSPVTVFDTILKRGHQEESNMSIDYRKMLHDVHENWLIKKAMPEFLDIPIIELDASLPSELIGTEYDRCMNENFQIVNQQSDAMKGRLIWEKESVLGYKKLSDEAHVPTKSSDHAAGYDLYR